MDIVLEFFFNLLIKPISEFLVRPYNQLSQTRKGNKVLAFIFLFPLLVSIVIALGISVVMVFISALEFSVTKIFILALEFGVIPVFISIVYFAIIGLPMCWHHFTLSRLIPPNKRVILPSQLRLLRIQKNEAQSNKYAKWLFDAVCDTFIGFPKDVFLLGEREANPTKQFQLEKITSIFEFIWISREKLQYVIPIPGILRMIGGFHFLLLLFGIALISSAWLFAICLALPIMYITARMWIYYGAANELDKKEESFWDNWINNPAHEIIEKQDYDKQESSILTPPKAVQSKGDRETEKKVLFMPVVYKKMNTDSILKLVLVALLAAFVGIGSTILAVLFYLIGIKWEICWAFPCAFMGWFFLIISGLAIRHSHKSIYKLVECPACNSRFWIAKNKKMGICPYCGQRGINFGYKS